MQHTPFPFLYSCNTAILTNMRDQVDLFQAAATTFKLLSDTGFQRTEQEAQVVGKRRQFESMELCEHFQAPLESINDIQSFADDMSILYPMENYRP